jgi:hypothetical protein
VALLRGRGLIICEELIDHSEERPQLGSGPLDLTLLVGRWLDVLEHLGDRVVF